MTPVPVESGSESDQDAAINRGNCYACDKAYSDDFIECANCGRRFHIACVSDDYLNVEGLEFECKYC